MLQGPPRGQGRSSNYLGIILNLWVLSLLRNSKKLMFAGVVQYSVGFRAYPKWVRAMGLYTHATGIRSVGIFRAIMREVNARCAPLKGSRV